MRTSVSVAELNDIREAGGAVVVIDTLPPEYYAEGHIPGALNACVYEVIFLDTVAGLAADRNARLVVYGSSNRSRGAAVAVEKLKRAGYRDVSELAGGLESWVAAGLALEPAGLPRREEPACGDGRYIVDAAASRLEWSGRNINGRHYGTIAVANGELDVENGSITGGKITLDMNTIMDLDLKDEGYNRMLISHLKSDDFFDVERYPTASYLITGAERLPAAAPGSPSHLLKGSLELKGTSRGLNLPVEIAPQEKGQLKARAACDLDRTEWGVIYGSGRYFENLGMHLVSDIVSIELFLTANRK